MHNIVDAAKIWQKAHAEGFREACEKKREGREIEAIALELHRPAQEIARLYTEVYADLKAHARVTDYLQLFVSRRLRARYRTASNEDV